MAALADCNQQVRLLFLAALYQYDRDRAACVSEHKLLLGHGDVGDQQRRNL